MKRSLIVGAPMLALVLAGACSSDSTSPLLITSADVDQAAVISASDATAEDVGILSASDMTMSGGAVQNVVGGGLMLSRVPVGAPSYAWTFGDGCTYSASTGRFGCPGLSFRFHPGLLGGLGALLGGRPAGVGPLGPALGPARRGLGRLGAALGVLHPALRLHPARRFGL